MIEAAALTRKVAIDFLYLDLDTCDRCIGTNTNLDAALDQIAHLLQAAGIQVLVQKTHVASEDQARKLRFVSSPTLRVNGQDVALELRESPCGAEACTCNGGIDCRVWVWQGQELTEAPTPMTVDAILGEVYGGSDRPVTEALLPEDVPENLKRFFASKREQPSNQATEMSCCSATEQATCCEPSAKTSCCGAAPAGSCGCQ
jgi:hypothetical protein